MARDTLTGSRIRERRIARGIKQSELAQKSGISASYLNLIEHNRRRIGGKLLVDIASVLEVEPTVLTEGAGAAMLASLRDVAAAVPQAGAEIDRVDEFAGRFPGWARLMADRTERIAALERMVETLNDRITHDPHLATSLHEMLTTVTAIRSTATILADPGEVEPEWQARFMRNIMEDSVRLADSSRSLVTYLEADGETITETGTPQEEMHDALDAIDHHVDVLEQGGRVSDALPEVADGLTAPGHSLMRAWLERYALDARQLPMDRLLGAVDQVGLDPAELALTLGVDPARIMRRLANMPAEALPDPVGLAICDASGVLTYRKTVPAFPLPRVGAGCPIWPLYRALSRPHVILSQPLARAGRPGESIWVDALATPRDAVSVNRDPILQGHMLLRARPQGSVAAHAEEVGVTCRICPRQICSERREPSVMLGSDR